jgi:hypothetical protein
MQVIVAATMSNDPEVHRLGCADVKRGLARGKYQTAYKVTVDNAEAAADWFWEDFLPGGCAYEESGPGTGMTHDDAVSYTKFYPCLNK